MKRIGAIIVSFLVISVNLAFVGLASPQVQQNDMGSGSDASDYTGTATIISPGSGTGYLDPIGGDWYDYYKIRVDSGQTLMISLTAPSGIDNTNLILFGPNMEADYAIISGGQTDTVEYTATASCYCTISVYTLSAGSGTYSMTVTVSSGGGITQNDMGTGGDASNYSETATLISPSSGTGYFDSGDWMDIYKVMVNPGQTVGVSLTAPSGAECFMNIHGPDMQGLDTSGTISGGQTGTVEYTGTESDYCYIAIYRYTGSGTYSMTVTVSGGTGGAGQNDMNTGTDARNSLSTATSISPSSGTGYIDDTDTDDYYKVNVSSGQVISASMAPPSGSDFDLKLYNQNQKEVDSSNLDESQTDTVEFTATDSGYCYVHVYRYNGSGTYSMTVTVTGTAASAQNDWNSGRDAGNNFDQALTITAGTGTGYVHETDDTNDYYKIQVGQNATICATLTPPDGSDFDLVLYAENRREVDSSLNNGSQAETVIYYTDSAGTYYVRVFCFEGSGIYTLDVSVPSASSLAESPHPYPNDFDYTWTITQAGAGAIRAHFSYLYTESGWDYVYVYDENNTLIESFSGSYSNRWTSWVSGSTIRIRLVSDTAVTDYGFIVDSVETGVAVPVIPTNKYAVIAGVNNYANINDLRFAVNDAQDWKNYLFGHGYTISAFLTDSQATEENIRAAITGAIAQAGPNDTLVLVFSGHGTNSSPGDLYAYCCYDAGTTGIGYLTGMELQDLVRGYQGRLFVFFDSCYSGGMDGGLINTPKRYMTTTCSEYGYGYDVASYSNGAWTYWYLERGLVGQGYTTAEQTFDWAKSNYPYTGNDAPEEFDGDTENNFLV